MTNCVDPDQTAPIGADDLGPPCLLLYLNSLVMLDNYLQQTTSADVIFSDAFFLGALRANVQPKHLMQPYSLQYLIIMHR